MTRTTFFFSLKVWLSAVFFAPIILFTGMCVSNFSQVDLSNIFTAGQEMYQTLLMFGAAFSFPTYLIFLLAIMIAMKSTDSPRRRKLLVAGIGFTLAIGTFSTFFYLFHLQIDQFFFFLSLSYCTCIGAGSLFYRLEAKEEPDLEISHVEQ